MAEWRDVTSWTRSDDAEARKTPRSWALGLKQGQVELVMTQHIGLPGRPWAVMLFPWPWDHTRHIELGTTHGTADEAKAAAVSALRSWLTNMLGGLP